ncbi:hypothetical protein [Evansella sp. LMS18]|nr:hypothetical protein [Evansella sp. LMS18]
MGLIAFCVAAGALATALFAETRASKLEKRVSELEEKLDNLK